MQRTMHVFSTLRMIMLAGLLLAGCSKNRYLNEASKAEALGNYNGAMDFYIEELFRLTKHFSYLDDRKSVFSSPMQWNDEVEKYHSWILPGTANLTPEFLKIIQHIEACSSRVKREVFIGKRKPVALTKEAMVQKWNAVFTPENKNLGTVLNPGAETAFSRNVSFIELEAFNEFTYHGALVNRRDGKRTVFSVFPNTTRSLIATAGDYYLVLKSEVIFTQQARKQVWRSSYNVYVITVPEGQSAVYSWALQTKVKP